MKFNSDSSMQNASTPPHILIRFAAQRKFEPELTIQIHRALWLRIPPSFLQRSKLTLMQTACETGCGVTAHG
jgi:hypothetical protein